MIYMLLADGFEEIEALCPLDMLRRAGCGVKTLSVTGCRRVLGSHGIPVEADLLEEEITEPVDGVILPGGMPGSLHLDASPTTDRMLADAMGQGGRIAAICAAPLVLGHRDLLVGRRAVCYPGFEGELKGATVAEGSRVVTDGNITTAVGMGAACELGLALVTLLVGREAAEKIENGAFIALPKA